MADTVLTELKIHEFDSLEQMSQYESEIGDNDIVFTPDLSCRLPLLTPMWFDHVANDVSWLRADTFSWQSGDVYEAAYEHLVNDFETANASQTDTIGDITITYYLAQDGHKICLPDQESNIVALYESTGVAWYYILDTDNQQFKLPRSKHNKYIDTAPVIGNGMALGLTDGTNNAGIYDRNMASLAGSAALQLSKNAYGTSVGTSVSEDTSWGTNPNKTIGITTDPAKSGIVAQQTQDTDQYKYLYFYVGNFEQSAIEQTAGITAETLNGKADTDLGNLPTNYDYVVDSQMPTADNGYTWYRKYKSGWVEMGGRLSGRSVTFPIEFASSPTIATSQTDSATICAVTTNIYDITTTGFSGHRTQIADTWHNWVMDMNGMWVAYGMSAQ